MQNCLASTGINTSEIALAALGLIAIGVGGVLLARRYGIKSYSWVAFVMVGGFVASALLAPQTFADSCSDVSTDTSVTSVATSTPGTTTGAATEAQIFNALEHVTPSAGASFVATSLKLSLVDNAVAGSAVSNDGKTVTVPGEGTYTANSNGTISFTPVNGFTGTAKGVRFSLTDTKSSTTTNIYTPSVQPMVSTCQQITLPQLSVMIEQKADDTLTVSGPVLIAANITDQNGNLLSSSAQAQIANLIDLNPSIPGMQTTYDQSADGGFILKYDPASDQLSLTITDQTLFMQYTESLGAGLSYTTEDTSNYCTSAAGTISFSVFAFS